jgi:hypothetical protein
MQAAIRAFMVFFSSIDVDFCDEIQMRMTMIPFFLNFFIAIGNY